jgi:hypothetical protein
MSKADKRKRQTIDVMLKVGTEDLYVNHGEKIRIKNTKNKMKVIIAREISRWLSAPSRYWSFTSSLDQNTDRLLEHLIEMFPDYTWSKNNSQGAIDFVSLDAGVAVEVKGTRPRAKQILANASIYPDMVTAVDVLGKNFEWKDFDPNTKLDCLVACVERSKKDKVYNFAIVDGTYWGFTEEDFKNCHLLFSQMNNPTFKAKINALFLSEYDNSFFEKLVKGNFGNGVTLNFRKLIYISNPVGRLTTSGWWHIG